MRGRKRQTKNHRRTSWARGEQENAVHVASMKGRRKEYEREREDTDAHISCSDTGSSEYPVKVTVP